ncbi:hypothetical protein Agabi119p4_11427 [Agaricus bisporus var. burnettii]|uniref:AAA+ ATPase domain-containing protein n=1 Tax=Agaricus bisporus var. burnettii TaxID=192524 RepID=A0A8H7EV12_AGABI|nr:hypothetical protein Agabi119p4_11427 [Agaricus bisporus var. burnettii]
MFIVRLNQKTTFQTRNPLRRPTYSNTGPKEGLLKAAEDPWLQSDEDESSFAKWASSVDPTSSLRFDWRKRSGSREITLSTPDNRKRYPKRKIPAIDPLRPGEPYFDAIQSYQNHFLPLLESEEAESRNDITERLSSWSIARLKEEGYCLTDLCAYWCKTNQYGKPVAAFQLGPGIILPSGLKFENGGEIMVSRLNPLEEQPFKGSIVELTQTQMKVCFPTEFEEEGLWRVDLDRSNIIFERMRKAMSYLHYDVDYLERLPRARDQEVILHGTNLRDVLLQSEDPSRVEAGNQDFHTLQAADDVSYPTDVLSHDVRGFSTKEFESIFKDDMRIHSWVERYLRDDPLVMEGDPDFKHLNKSQIKAMATMIGKRISLVQGPPGTGKTKTIVETIKLLKLHFEVSHPILVCTYTNVAVDNLLEGFAKAGLKPLRVGFGSRIRASLQEYSLDHLLLKHPLQPLLLETIALLDKMEEEIGQLGALIRDTLKKIEGKTPSAAMEQRVRNMSQAMGMKDRRRNELRAKKYGLQQEMLHDIVKSADVVCSTCITSASSALNVADFPVVFVDEASMSTEPATLIPIMKGSRHLALIGDHKQLPPVIVSQEARAQGLAVSLFERLTEEGIVPSVMLDIQYRMHPRISHFPSLEFYNSSIQDGTTDKDGNVVVGLEPPMSLTHLLQDGNHEGQSRSRPSVIFLDHFGYETMSGRSRVNHHEAQIVVSLVEDLLLQNPQLRGQDIGIIAPYVAQINLLNRLLTTDVRNGERFREVLGNQRYRDMSDVEVKTVDGFEGREKEVIVFSTVRNNDSGRIGFLADRRRLNVGLTRAKRGLFVVGGMRTIGGPIREAEYGVTVAGVGVKKRGGKGADSWKRYAAWLAKEGLVLKLVGEKLDRVLYGNLRLMSTKRDSLRGTT